MAKHEARYREAEARLWSSVGVQPTERRVHLARTEATVRVQEAGSGPPVVLVHGASNSGTSWAPLVAGLDGFRCIMLDRPGCGLSDPLGYELDDVGQLAAFGDALVVDVLDALELEHAHVIGTSFGGYMAMRAAAAHPDRVDRMVEFGWLIGAPVGRTPAVMRLAGIPAVGRVLAAIPPNERAVRSLLRNIGLGHALDSGRFSQVAVEWYLALMRDTETMRNELRTGHRIFRPLGGMDDSLVLPASLLAMIHTPIQFVWGEDDPLGGAEVARRFVAQIPDARLELMAGAGHAVWMDEPDRVAATTSAFLSQ